MNIKDLGTDYKIVSAPESSGKAPTNIRDLGNDYTTQSSSPTPQQPQTPLLTNPNGGFGTALKDVAVGAGKDIIRGGREVANLAQQGGKAILGAFGADTSQMGIRSIDNSTPEGAQVNEQLQSKSRGEQVGTVLSNVAQLGTGFATKEGQAGVKIAKQGLETYQAGKEAKATEKATNSVTKMISPSATSKEAKLAQTQGRLVPGKEPTLFRSGTEDTILPSKKTLSASDTVVKNIPNASKMKPNELYKAVDDNITKTSQTLRPQMEATPIKPETVDKINNNWEALKKTQMTDAPATEEANVAKRQAKFESTLRKSGSGTHADLWDTRIAYDDSIAENVKKANINSPESLQIQKDEWLQNRQILNDAINDTAHGMGKTSQEAFAKMSDLYNAKTNLLSNTKLNKGLPSKISQAYNSPVGKGVRNVAKGVAVFEGGKKLLTGGF